jgi:diadenosine tetraphosphate (Ap4A) HIT family hydrolase
VSVQRPPACELCASEGGTVLWRDAQLRVVAVDDADYPGMLRVIWNEHVREWSDLPSDARARLLQVVFVVEQVLRGALRPDKINLASLGNVVPHLHWHVIPRFVDDAHFPQPIWGTRQRVCDPGLLATRRGAGAHLPALIGRALSTSPSPRIDPAR